MSKKKGFWLKLVANGESDTVSHKRLISLISFLCLIIFGFLSAFGHSMEGDYVYVFAILTGGESMLTVVEKMKGGFNRIKRIGENENEDYE